MTLDEIRIDNFDSRTDSLYHLLTSSDFGFVASESPTIMENQDRVIFSTPTRDGVIQRMLFSDRLRHYTNNNNEVIDADHSEINAFLESISNV